MTTEKRVVMKNHVTVGGRLLQTNKKWSSLKQSQRDWIYEQLRIEHDAYIEFNKKLPMKKRKDIIIDAVYAKVEKRGIWIPYGEYHDRVSVFIDRLNRKDPLFIRLEKKDEKLPKPVMQKEGVERFPLDAQIAIKEKMSKCIKSYISQAKRIPYNKRRDADLTIVVRYFNSRYSNRYSKFLNKDDALFALYDELKTEIFAEMSENGQL